MRSRILLAAELTVALSITTIVIATLKAHGNQNAVPFDKQIPVAVEQLPEAGGVLPVEVRCGVARLTAPNALEPFSCMAINNTKKNIVALAAALTLVTEKNGEGESSDTKLLTVDSLVHPDIRSARRLRSIQPGAAHPIQLPGPIAYEDETIARVELSIDYVEFESDASLGPDKHGSRSIRSTREGAARYKAWLNKKYQLNGQDGSAVTEALAESALPADLQLGDDGDMIAGARMYRRVMLGVYEQQGAAGLKKYLSR